MLNIIALMGRLVADPELRKTPNGISTTTFTIACERSYAKSGTERQTDFIDIVAWRNTAEFVCKYFRKGQLLAVNGSLQTRTYEDKEGKKRKVFEVMADNVHFAESKSSSASYSNNSMPAAPTYGESAPSQTAQRALPQEPETYSAGSVDDFAIIDDSEDLPF